MTAIKFIESVAAGIQAYPIDTQADLFRDLVNGYAEAPDCDPAILDLLCEYSDRAQSELLNAEAQGHIGYPLPARAEPTLPEVVAQFYNGQM